MSPNADPPSETAVKTDISAFTNQSATLIGGMLLRSSVIYICIGILLPVVALWCSGSALASHARGPGFNSWVG